VKRPAWIAAAIIIVATSLAAGWALYLPMLLSPDEDSHYDYALTLYTAGRTMRPDEKIQGRDTHPSLEYLMTRTHVRQMRLNERVRAEPGYGTPDYLRALDAQAPPIDVQRFKNGPIVPVPYISRLYPFGYYALGAGAISLATLSAPHSIVRQFYFVRFLSVALLPITLFFTWLSFRELGLGERRSLLLLAAVAFLPLTAWMAGSVQPDNLVCALAAAIVFTALRLRRDPQNLRIYLALGLLLAALIATKRHYFASLFLPIALLAGVRLWRPFDLKRTAAAMLLLAGLPVLGFLATEPALKTLPGASGVCLLSSGGGSPRDVYLAGLHEAFVNTFLDSLGTRSFWNSYSAYRNSYIDIGSPAVTHAIVTMIPGLTLIVAALFLIRTAQNAVRVARVARRRGTLSALRIVSSNVLVNGYLTFFAILWTYELMVGGHVGIQGRYWLPFLAAIWYITVQIAPRALPRSYAKAATIVLLAMILIYDAGATAFAFPSIHARFYGPPVAPDPKLDLFTHFSAGRRIDINGVDLGTIRRDHPPVRLWGVVLDMRSASGPLKAYVLIDGTKRVDTVPAARPDIECDTEKSFLNTGFEAVIDPSTLAPGRHRLTILATTPWSSQPIEGNGTATFEVR
jgi:hypothetical protein